MTIWVKQGEQLFVLDADRWDDSISMVTVFKGKETVARFSWVDAIWKYDSLRSRFTA